MVQRVLFTAASSPEEAGIPSSSILRFIERVEREGICMHGFMLLRKGYIAAEGYWAPYTAQSMHRMYSVSKSMVSLAVGFMIDEGKLTLDDKVVEFFPDKTSEKVHPYLAQATIRDLLMMATPHSSNSYTKEDKDWARTFFEKTPSHPPGTIFAYDTAATVVLNTIVERISGVPFLEYLRPRLLDSIGFSKDAWCIRTPEGTSWGGSGVICTLRDMAKVAYVCMNNGCWGRTRLISSEYISEATSKQIDNSISGNLGYGYQIWRLKENGFAFIGMGSQLALCFPDRDFLFACIADTQSMPNGTDMVMKAFYDELYGRLADEPLQTEPGKYSELLERMHALKVLPQKGQTTSVAAERVHGVWYKLDDNPMQITRMRLMLDENEGVWEYTNTSGDHHLRFGIGKKVSDWFPQRNYYGDQIGTAPGIQYACLSSAAWVEEHKLNMLVYITDHYLGTLKVTFVFKGKDIAIYMTKAAEWFLDEYNGFAGGSME